MTLKLQRGLNLTAAASVVIGSMIGTGVFLKAAMMSQLVPSPLLVLGIWVFAGLLSLAGALSYAELGGLFPEAGGEYVFLREAYGELPAFLFGWMRFWIASPGSIAAYAVGAATFARGLFAQGLPVSANTLAVSVILLFTAINCLSIRTSGWVQSTMTGIKILSMFAITAGAFFLSTSGSLGNITSAAQGASGFLTGSLIGSGVGWSAIGAATLAALWAYDGWSNVTLLAGEVHRPQRNIPLALIGGTATVMLIYVAIHAGYFYALPIGEIATANSQAHPDALPAAAKVIASFGWSGGSEFVTRIISAVFIFSSLGAMHASVASGARVPYAMARDGLFFGALGRLDPRTHVPMRSVLLQGVLSAGLALAGNFDELTDYVVFASWIFYGLVTGAVFVFRRRMPDAHRPYRSAGYPWVPAIFILVSAALLVNTALTSARSAMAGLVFIALGVPVFHLFRRTLGRPAQLAMEENRKL